MSAAARAHGADDAFAGVIAGQPIVGLEPGEIELLAQQNKKVSTRDLAPAAARGEHGGTTVAATIFLAARAGIDVAATGGIGGVHPTPAGQDVSADLLELARTPIVLVCSGAKAIVDLAATLERLETLAVAVVGFKTDEFPAFWSAESGLPVSHRVERPDEVAEIYRRARALGAPGALIVCVPPPSDVALKREEVDLAVSHALSDLAMEGLSGPGVTPYLLARIVDLTGGRSLQANLSLLQNNTAVAAMIARAILNLT
jgi:pseudouridine-5'-phosphate glycosidase